MGLGYAVGHQRGTDALEAEDSRVAVLDHHRRPGKRRQVGQQIAQLAGGEGGHQVGQALALHRGHYGAVKLHCVVAGGKGPPGGVGLLAGELPRIALANVDTMVSRPPALRACGTPT